MSAERKHKWVSSVNTHTSAISRPLSPPFPDAAGLDRHDRVIYNKALPGLFWFLSWSPGLCWSLASFRRAKPANSSYQVSTTSLVCDSTCTLMLRHSVLFFSAPKDESRPQDNVAPILEIATSVINDLSSTFPQLYVRLTKCGDVGNSSRSGSRCIVVPRPCGTRSGHQILKNDASAKFRDTREPHDGAHSPGSWYCTR